MASFSLRLMGDQVNISIPDVVLCQLRHPDNICCDHLGIIQCPIPTIPNQTISFNLFFPLYSQLSVSRRKDNIKTDSILNSSKLLLNQLKLLKKLYTVIYHSTCRAYNINSGCLQHLFSNAKVKNLAYFFFFFYYLTGTIR